MIYFRDHYWLPVQGYSRFDALIQTDDQKREDVFWMLDFRCVAAGAEWRRVRHWERPSLWVQVNGFKPKLRDWRDLETLNYWNWEEKWPRTRSSDQAAGWTWSFIRDAARTNVKNPL